MKSAGISDIGLHRKRNEDSFFIDEDQGIFIVCDGMGGHKGGDVASQLAVQTIRDHLHFTQGEDIVPLLCQSVQAANTAINTMGGRVDALREMGTTATIAIIRDKEMTVAHVGDSSLYLFHAGILTRITRAHTLAEQMAADGFLSDGNRPNSGYSHILTRAVGIEPVINVDIYQLGIANGDQVLLCSDGLTDMMTDEQIGKVMAISGGPELKARLLVDAALANGGFDNVTVLVVSV